MKLSDQHLRTLKSIMKAVKLTQAQASEAIGVTGSLLSMALNENLAERGLRKEKWEALFNAIRQAIKAYPTKYPGVKAPHALAKLEHDLARINHTIFETDGVILTRPGTLIVMGAVDCIKLNNEDALHELVRNSGVFTVLIQGSIRSGRSSLLQRLVKTAQDVGHRTYRVNFSTCVLITEDKLKLRDLYEFTFQSLGCPFDPTQNEFRWQFGFIDWARAQWNKDTVRPVSVFLDGLECLATNEIKRQTIVRFLTWLNSLRDYAGEEPFDRFQIISLFSPYEADAFSDSAFHSQAGHLELLEFFTESQCIELAKRYELRNSESTGKSAFVRFGGQPYLTHLFVYRLHQQGCVYNNTNMTDELYRVALAQELKVVSKLSGDYGRYWNSIKLFLNSASSNNGRLLLERLAHNPGDLNSSEWSRLHLAGIAVPNEDGEMSVSEFVKTAMKLS